MFGHVYYTALSRLGFFYVGAIAAHLIRRFRILGMDELMKSAGGRVRPIIRVSICHPHNLFRTAESWWGGGRASGIPAPVNSSLNFDLYAGLHGRILTRNHDRYCPRMDMSKRWI